jgi:hypothetical protein
MSFFDVAQAHVQIGVALQCEHVEAREGSVERRERRLLSLYVAPVQRQ